MNRILPIAGLAVAALGLTGCVGAWDTLTSRKFRREPMTTVKHMIRPEDPLVILRADPPREGDERAKAMHRLKEPLANKLTQQDQDEVIDLLSRTATNDPSPVLRLAAIEALARFKDARVPEILMLAYRKSHGRADGAPDPFRADTEVKLAGGIRGRAGARPGLFPLTVPTGFPPETVQVIRCRTLEGIGRTAGPAGVQFLGTVAVGATSDTAPEGADDRDVRLAALRGLGLSRQPEAIVALAQVLTAENGKDTAIVGRTHIELVHLTGKKLPADPQQWNAVVQAGAVVAPEPSWFGGVVQAVATMRKP